MLARECAGRRQHEIIEETLVFALARNGAVADAKALAKRLHASAGWRTVAAALPTLDAATEHMAVEAARAEWRQSRSLHAADAFSATCIALAEFGSCEASLQLYKLMAEGPDRSASLPRMSYALARAGRADLAEALVADISIDPALAACATAAIAVGLAHRVRENEAGPLADSTAQLSRRLLIPILSGKHWTKALDAVGLVQPEALLGITSAAEM
ncbi:MAG TPA: hypothetical protein VEX88_12145 [Glaciibacter sp.]|nr:hypothetical protein [Glaciibacter sp.]